MHFKRGTHYRLDGKLSKVSFVARLGCRLPRWAILESAKVCHAPQMVEKKPTSEQLQAEVLELRKLADRLKKQAEELAIRSTELEKLVQRTGRRSPEGKPGR
jgi:hypothetical protein